MICPPSPQQAHFAWGRLCCVVLVFALLGIGGLSSVSDGPEGAWLGLGCFAVAIAYGAARWHVWRKYRRNTLLQEPQPADNQAGRDVRGKGVNRSNVRKQLPAFLIGQTIIIGAMSFHWWWPKVGAMIMSLRAETPVTIRVESFLPVTSHVDIPGDLGYRVFVKNPTDEPLAVRIKDITPDPLKAREDEEWPVVAKATAPPRSEVEIELKPQWAKFQIAMIPFGHDAPKPKQRGDIIQWLGTNGQFILESDGYADKTFSINVLLRDRDCKQGFAALDAAATAETESATKYVVAFVPSSLRKDWPTKADLIVTRRGTYKVPTQFSHYWDNPNASRPSNVSPASKPSSILPGSQADPWRFARMQSLSGGHLPEASVKALPERWESWPEQKEGRGAWEVHSYLHPKPHSN